MPIYEYECTGCKEYFTSLKSIAERDNASCPLCSAPGKKLISIPRIALDGTDPGFPGAWDKWERKRKQKLAQEVKARREHGDGIE